MQLQVSTADLLDFEGDAIVIPIDSTGLLTTDLGLRVKQRLGQRVEDEVLSHAPIAVGAALATSAEPLAARYLIHAPLVDEAGLRVGVENVRRATRASLLVADHYQLERIAAPAMGFGETGVSHDEAARAMVDECVGFKGPYPQVVVIVTGDDEMAEALRTYCEGR